RVRRNNDCDVDGHLARQWIRPKGFRANVRRCNVRRYGGCTSATASDATIGRHPMLRFRLRTLLIAVAMLAVPMAWVTIKARQQRITVAALESMGCQIGYEDVCGESFTIPERLKTFLG